MAEQAQPKANSIEAMFVQSAHGLSSDNRTVTLHGLAHSTLFFADRPQRVVGHVSSRKFVSEWGQGANSFEEDPPNAVISFLENGEKPPEEVTMILSEPRMDENNLTYNIEILDGKLPAKTGPCALFIDPIGRPLSPVSVAGMNRRDRRRDRR